MSEFEIGELILTSKPYVYVLYNSFRGKKCDYCFKSQSALKKCSACTFTYYCDKDCQAKAWKDHKQECKIILKAKPNEPTCTLRLIALILFKLKKYGYSEPCEEVFGRKVSFQALMSHASEIEKSVKKYQEMIALINTLKLYVGQCNIPLPSQFIQIFGKMCVNSFNICDDDMQNIGTGLYLGASVFDHSCEPDAEVVFDGVNLIIRAIKKVTKQDISKVHISYIDQYDLTKDRQKYLNDQYFFSCECIRCSSSYYDDLMMRQLVPNENVAIPWTELENTIIELTEMFKNKENSEAVYSGCVKFLSMYDDILSETHVCKVKMLELANHSSVYTQRWPEALSFARQLLKPYRLVYGPYHPALGTLLFRIAKLEQLLLTPFSPSSNITIQETAKVLKVVYGEYHPFYQKLSELDWRNQLENCDSILSTLSIGK